MQTLTLPAIVALVLQFAVPTFPQTTRADPAAMTSEIVKAGSVVLPGVSFVDDTAQLTAESSVTLDEVVKVLAAHEEWRFEVQGHTDNAGVPARSLALSEVRARVVVAWLTTHGVAPSRLVARGYGETKPLASNDTDAGRAKNRRIQLKKLNEE